MLTERERLESVDRQTGREADREVGRKRSESPSPDEREREREQACVYTCKRICEREREKCW